MFLDNKRICKFQSAQKKNIYLCAEGDPVWPVASDRYNKLDWQL